MTINTGKPNVSASPLFSFSRAAFAFLGALAYAWPS
jgi:hypothetical protein